MLKYNTLKILLVVIISASFASIFMIFIKNNMWILAEYQESDPLSSFEKKIECLKDWLPKSAVVGYVSDRPPVEYLFTVYTLVPVLVEVKEYSYPPYFVKDTGKDYDFLIENTHQDRFNENNYSVVIDCGNGVRLYKKRD